MRLTILYLSLFGPVAFASAVQRGRSSYDASHLEEKKLKLNHIIKQRSERDLQGPVIDIPVLSTAIQPANDTAFVSFVSQAKGSSSSGKGGMSMSSGMGMGKGGMSMGKGGMSMGKGGMSMGKGSLIPSTSLSPSPSLSLSPSPSTTISPSPSASIIPSLSISPTVCEDDDKGTMGMGKGGMSSMGKGGMSMGKGSMSMSGKGGKGMGKGECTDSPSATLSPSPSSSLSPSPSLSGSSTTTCVPTSGNCANSASELQDEIDLASAGSVIEICAGALIETQTAFILDQPSTTLCCSGCVMSGLGQDSVLFVTGSSVTIEGIVFQDGVSTQFNGGNVAIEADGNHVISKSTFVGGNSSFAGGNLFVETTGTITITGSTFTNGNAQTGGGVVILNATEVILANNAFFDNSALNGGAFYYAGDGTVSTSPTIEIRGGLFVGNTADIGGAMLFVDVINPPATISIINNDISDNEATEAGGAGVFLAALADFDLTLNNFGSGNSAGFICDDFLAFLDAGGVDTQCIDVNQIL